MSLSPASGHACTTVKPPIVDPLRKGHNIKTSLQGTLLELPKNFLPHSFNTLTTSKKRTTSLYKGQNYSEFILSPTCPLFRGSTVYKNKGVTLYLEYCGIAMAINIDTLFTPNRVTVTP